MVDEEKNRIDIEILKLSLDRGSHWFSVHAEQRMKLMNFYIAIIAAYLAFLAAIYEKDFFILQIFAGISLCAVTFVFYKLDQRTSYLIWCAEDALGAVEYEIFVNSCEKRHLIVQNSDHKRMNNGLSYTFLFRIVFMTGCLLAAIFILKGVGLVD